MSSLFSVPLDSLKGIGKSRVELFHKLGIHSVGSLIEFFPRRYEDWSTITPISDLQHNETFCVKATVGSPVNTVRVTGGKLITKVMVYDESATLKITFFNNRYIDSMLEYGKEYYFYGKVSVNIYGRQMIAPAFSTMENSSGLKPIYNQTAGLPNRIISKAVEQALSMLPEKIGDCLPLSLRKEFSLCDYNFAIHNIHFPKDTQHLKQAKMRLVCQELLILNLGMINLKNIKRSETALKLKKDCSKSFQSLLPYTLTNAQNEAVSDCIKDMTYSPYPMNRLVQGDVGSGKTAVAASLCYTCTQNGWQCAFMAPTEILAEQHYHSLSSLFKNTNIKVDLLTGSLTNNQKNNVRQKLETGETDIVIGTHALITDKTKFKNLGLAITDEQHRFGVSQRSALLSKGNNPHLLVMSATPIPRTLGLIIFGDLDISIIDELPPGRQEIQTMLINSKIRKRACNFIRENIQNGRQAYIICPLVSENEQDLASAEEYAAELMLKEFSDIPVGVLHGKMKPSEKEKVMKAFAENKLSLLVATTVVEVGVDVPNANIIMIENAERFGLSQLHQLRGRVGRGTHKSFCILVSDNKNPETQKRLNVLCQTSNGFKIADEDLQLRGPGDFFGSRQHGLPTLSIADFADTESLEKSRKMTEFLQTHKDTVTEKETAMLKRAISKLFEDGGNNILN